MKRALEESNLARKRGMYFESPRKRKQLYKDLDYSSQGWTCLRRSLSHTLLVMVDGKNGHRFFFLFAPKPLQCDVTDPPIKKWSIIFCLLNLGRACNLL